MNQNEPFYFFRLFQKLFRKFLGCLLPELILKLLSRSPVRRGSSKELGMGLRLRVRLVRLRLQPLGKSAIMIYHYDIRTENGNCSPTSQFENGRLVELGLGVIWHPTTYVQYRKYRHNIRSKVLWLVVIGLRSCGPRVPGSTKKDQQGRQ